MYIIKNRAVVYMYIHHMINKNFELQLLTITFDCLPMNTIPNEILRRIACLLLLTRCCV